MPTEMEWGILRMLQALRKGNPKVYQALQDQITLAYVALSREQGKMQ